jgi:hypothetical protein
VRHRWERQACEIRPRAERKAGELLRQTEKAMGSARTGHQSRRDAVGRYDRREPDAMKLLRSRYSTATPSHSATTDGLGPARTWIGDARLGRLIEDALDDAARSAGSDISRTLASGEETHVTVLFERLRGAFSAISDRLAALAVETNGNERFSLKLEHRVVGKPEEGGLGVGTKRFSGNELSRLCLGVLRTAAGELLSRDDIAGRVIAAKGFDAGDAILRVAIREQVGSTVKRLHRNRAIENIGAGRASKWKPAGA